MKKATILGIPPKTKAPNPIIEISGVPDCGKKLIAELIARRIGGYCVHCPNLDPTSFSGGAILHGAINNAKSLESNPYWWTHIYAANLHEKSEEILYYQKYGPVVVTNYICGMSIWAKSSGATNLSGFFRQLPKPEISFGLYGALWDTPGNLKTNHTPWFLLRLTNSFIARKEPRYVKILMGKSSKMWEDINSTAIEICGHLKERLKIKIDEGQLYKPTLQIHKE